MSNKNAATEDDVGKLHKLITRCHNLKAGAMLEMAEGFQELGLTEEIVNAINSRDLASIQKWVEYNGIQALGATEDGESELSKKLAKLKEAQSGKVIEFRDAIGD